jgi:hypothetical protein
MTIEGDRVKCGPCGTEFDLNRHPRCPLCGFGLGAEPRKHSAAVSPAQESQKTVCKTPLTPVPQLEALEPGVPRITSQSQRIGTWGQFNSYFPGKAVARVLANLIATEGRQHIPLDRVITTSVETFTSAGLTKLRGFPKDPREKSSVGRLVWHFVSTFHDMGLFSIRGGIAEDGSIPWKDKEWSRVEIALTKQGYEFAKLPNAVFDRGGEDQVLTQEERTWLLGHLKQLDEAGFREYGLLSRVWKFLSDGKNGKDDLQAWFKGNAEFVSYIKEWSKKADDEEKFEDQLTNVATMFASSKVALLREFGIVANKRNDYTVLINPEE